MSGIVLPCGSLAGVERGFAPEGEEAGGPDAHTLIAASTPADQPSGSLLPRRFQGLPTASALGLELPVAAGFRSRLLGLARLDLGEAPAGLILPRCSSVHTFGMRFPLDLHFLDARGGVIRSVLGVPPRRIVWCRGAAAVAELPVRGARGGENPAAAP